jgi:hypothetical protein
MHLSTNADSGVMPKKAGNEDQTEQSKFRRRRFLEAE